MYTDVQPFAWSNINTIFSFGDSFTTSGFALGKVTPSLANPLGALPGQPLWGHPSSAGPNYIWSLTAEFNRSEIVTYNLAQGGATVSRSLVATKRPEVLCLDQQVEQEFLPKLAPQFGKTWTYDGALAVIWIGINDIAGTSGRPPKNTPEYYNKILDVYFNQVRKLADSGLRNFLFLNVPPIDQSPEFHQWGVEAMKAGTEAIKLFNTLLTARINEFRNTRDVEAYMFDANSAFKRYLKDPHSIGIKISGRGCRSYQNGTPSPTTMRAPCKHSVDRYFYRDTLHPTWRVHQALARDIATLFESIYHIEDVNSISS